MKNIEDLRKAMAKGAVEFKYYKRNGSIRVAKGTTNPEIIGSNYSAKGGFGPKDFGNVPYWDLDKNAWRSFDPANYIAEEA